MKLEELVSEVRVWSRHNFGAQESWRPFIGIGEEIGELFAATDDKAHVDAVADCLIYFCDWIGGYAPEIVPRLRYDTPPGMLPIVYGSLCRVVLKRAQGIRNMSSPELLTVACNAFLSSLAAAAGDDLLGLTSEVWTEVRKRDWKRFPKNGLSE